MHIAYLTTEYPHKNLPPAGGIGTFIKNMAHSLVSKGHIVTIFICNGNRDLEWFDDGVKIVELPRNYSGFIGLLRFRNKINKSVKKHIKENGVNIVESPDWEGLHAFCNFKTPIITRIHGSVTYFNHLQGLRVSPLINYFERKGLKLSHGIVAVSSYAGELTKDVFRLPKLRYDVIYNGVNVNNFTPTPRYKNTYDILYLGTLIRKKGLLELAYIFNELQNINPKTRLILVGKDGRDPIEKTSTWSMMQKILTTSAHNNVDYKGIIPYHKVKDIINKCDVCVFPSFAEAFPISWLEAMAMEKAIVASSVGWAKESIIDGESGFLEHPTNHTQFAKKINRLLLDSKLSKRIGVNARKRVKYFFNEEFLIDQNINYYNKIIHG